MKKLSLFYVLAAVAVIFSSCGGGLSGKYKGEGPMGISTIEIEFKSNGKALVTGGGMGMSSTQEIDYEKDGDQVKLIVGGQNQILTIDKDGCLDGMSTKLCKEK